jgi:hypothetical protein
MELVGGGSTGWQAYVDDVLRLCRLPSFFGCEHVNMGVARLRRLLLPAVCDIDQELHNDFITFRVSLRVTYSSFSSFPCLYLHLVHAAGTRAYARKVLYAIHTSGT